MPKRMEQQRRRAGTCHTPHGLTLILTLRRPHTTLRLLKGEDLEDDVFEANELRLKSA